MGVFKVWVPSREHMSVQALYDAANVLYWKISERQNSTHLAFLKHQNTKTSLYKLSKNHWVIELFKISLSVRRKLQSTVSLDHPVVHHKDCRVSLSMPCPHLKNVSQMYCKCNTVLANPSTAGSAKFANRSHTPAMARD